MYKNGEAAIARILELVEKCPKELHEKCFEVLLTGYVQTEVGLLKPSTASTPQNQNVSKQKETPDSHIPESVLPRFKNTAKRLGIGLDKLESLFDFSIDPFAMHALSLPGKNNAEKTRNIALLAAFRAYLATGNWSADWQEVKSLSVDYNCYNLANHVVYLKKGANSLFKSIESGSPIELSSGGIQESEKLIKGIAEGITL